jgi:polysaccharide export outer membrane protein
MKGAAFVLICAVLAAQGRPPLKQDVNYVVGPADVLRVNVFGEPQMSGAFRIENDGYFSYPFLGRVPAGGRAVADVAALLRLRLADGYLRDPQVTVEVEVFRSQSVFVMGEVRSPGKYVLSGAVTLLDALAQAGATTASAGDEVLILHPNGGIIADVPTLPDRPDALIEHINLREIEDGRLSRNVMIRDGDTIFVPRVDRFFVVGMVRNPGSFPLERNMTVLQAISTAGGITERGSNRRLKIQRIVNSKRKELAAKPTDIVQPGDTIVVPQRLL